MRAVLIGIGTFIAAFILLSLPYWVSVGAALVMLGFALRDTTA